MANAAAISDLTSGVDDMTSVALARVGPNAIIQLGETLKHRLGERCALDVFERAGLPAMLSEPPTDMVSERVVKTVFDALFDTLDVEQATAIAREAGVRTADYIMANRIPAPARFVLKALPAALAAPVLLRAISRNAWTFAGSGAVTVHAGTPHVLEVTGNPITTPGCVWHVGVFERLFQSLVARHASVSHTQCGRDGGDICRFEIATR